MMGFTTNQKRLWIRPIALVALTIGLLGIHSRADTTAVVDTRVADGLIAKAALTEAAAFAAGWKAGLRAA